jgi:hypothetical protein
VLDTARQRVCRLLCFDELAISTSSAQFVDENYKLGVGHVLSIWIMLVFFMMIIIVMIIIKVIPFCTRRLCPLRDLGETPRRQ